MRKLVLTLSWVLCFVCSGTSFADERKLIFINPNVADKVLQQYFGNLVSSNKFTFNDNTTDSDVLNAVADAYLDMLKNNEGLVSVLGIMDVCNAGFKNVVLDAENPAVIQEDITQYCKEFAKSLVNTQVDEENNCLYEITKVNGSQMRIKYENPDNGTGFIRKGGTIAWRFFNPGAMRRSSLQCTRLSTKPNGTFAVFDSYETGHQALINLLKNDKYLWLTVRKVIELYAPPTENNTESYISTLRSNGININATVESLSAEHFNQLVRMIETIEGWKPAGVGTIEEF